jgi:NarL family two-component system response regulator LiaR
MNTIRISGGRPRGGPFRAVQIPYGQQDLELPEADGSEDAGAHQPDVVLMDLMMPGVDGITATREIHKKYPQVKIIALTSFSDQNMVQGALQAGAAGYLQKNVTAAELVNAIRSAHAGRMTLSPEAVQVLANSVTQPQLPEKCADRARV